MMEDIVSRWQEPLFFLTNTGVVLTPFAHKSSKAECQLVIFVTPSSEAFCLYN